MCFPWRWCDSRRLRLEVYAPSTPSCPQCRSSKSVLWHGAENPRGSLHPKIDGPKRRLRVCAAIQKSIRNGRKSHKLLACRLLNLRNILRSHSRFGVEKGLPTASVASFYPHCETGRCCRCFSQKITVLTETGDDLPVVFPQVGNRWTLLHLQDDRVIATSYLHLRTRFGPEKGAPIFSNSGQPVLFPTG